MINITSQKSVTVISSPSHAWGKVPMQELITLGIADKISKYSYALGVWTYLEEDSDLGIYKKALLETGVEPKWVIEQVESFNRDDYWSFKDEPVVNYINTQMSD